MLESRLSSQLALLLVGVWRVDAIRMGGQEPAGDGAQRVGDGGRGGQAAEQEEEGAKARAA